ncbi:glycolipid transfer protein domain-containing protein [Suillus paluster]|uniref:glycolipid transfer protein domain-containing protein n=1 Tax=Suillus paluster TaxID=48578 RepID=UPI001B875EE5|nr:glycolipid transfer protein domain-containing protein [Suillus paluster]KAG1747739.1 glycolipid transfer protein domain-containing protein [Suillus paluster]
MSSRPYFETVKSFADVPITINGVETLVFLEASEGLVQLFDLLGSGVFGFVQSDIKGNIGERLLICLGVRAQYQTDSLHCSTLENLLISERSSQDRPGTGCLIRLTRGLTFLCRALQHMQNDPSMELHVCFKRSYDEVLRHHHTFFVRSLAAVAVRAAPYRRDFYTRISQGAPVEKLDEELARWLSGLDVIVKRLKEFIEGEGYGRI